MLHSRRSAVVVLRQALHPHAGLLAQGLQPAIRQLRLHLYQKMQTAVLPQDPNPPGKPDCASTARIRSRRSR